VKNGMNQHQRAEITAHGDVQAVGYRYAVRRAATKLKIRGYVQNMPDGTVRIVAEAPKNTIAEFIKTIQIKEPPINVERIETRYSKPTGKFKFFTMKYGDLSEEMAEGFGTGLSYINVSRAENKQGFQTLGNKMDDGFKTLGGKTEEGFKRLGNKMDDGFKTLGGKTEEGFKRLGNKMDDGFKTLGAESRQGFQDLKTEISGMREDMNKNFKQMSTKYDAISQNLSEAVKAIQSESVKTRTELIRAVDNLSRLVAEFIKKK